MELKTGDILLFNEHPNGWIDSFVDKTIKCFTKSKYSHVGFVIVDPEWAPKGTYVWDSSEHHVPDPQDNKIKFGIALVPIKEYLSTKNNHIVETLLLQEFTNLWEKMLMSTRKRRKPEETCILIPNGIDNLLGTTSQTCVDDFVACIT
jgi:hypothetical protein